MSDTCDCPHCNVDPEAEGDVCERELRRRPPRRARGCDAVTREERMEALLREALREFDGYDVLPGTQRVLRDRIRAQLDEPEGEARELDVVETLTDMRGEHELTGAVDIPRGSRGTVIDKWIYVEFSRDDGVPWAFASYSDDEVRSIYRPEPEYVWRVVSVSGEPWSYGAGDERDARDYQRTYGGRVERAAVGEWEAVE